MVKLKLVTVSNSHLTYYDFLKNLLEYKRHMGISYLAFSSCDFSLFTSKGNSSFDSCNLTILNELQNAMGKSLHSHR